VTDEQILRFLQTHIRSVWALELMLLLARDRSQAWRPGDLVREMRSSPVAVGEALRDLEKAGLAAADADGRFRYCPASPELDELASGIAQAYSVKPAAIVKAIATASDDKLRLFADAFRLKDQ
jgi:DNA-binding transcriptional ArsR family regulator